MSTRRATAFVRLGGLVCGLALAAALVLSGRVPASDSTVPAQVTIASQPTEEVGVSPAGKALIRANHLLPGISRRGTVTVSNYSDAGRLLRARLSSSSRDLDRALQVSIEASGQRLFDGFLHQLRSWTPGSLALAPGEWRRVELRVWIEAAPGAGWQGRAADLMLEWDSEERE